MCHAVLWEQAARGHRQRQGIGSSSDAGGSGIASAGGSGKALALVPMQVGRASPARTQTADEPAMCAIAAAVSAAACSSELVT